MAGRAAEHQQPDRRVQRRIVVPNPDQKRGRQCERVSSAEADEEIPYDGRRWLRWFVDFSLLGWQLDSMVLEQLADPCYRRGNSHQLGSLRPEARDPHGEAGVVDDAADAGLAAIRIRRQRRRMRLRARVRRACGAPDATPQQIRGVALKT